MFEGYWVEIFAFYCVVVLHFLQRHNDSWISVSAVPLVRGMDSRNQQGLERLQKVGAVIQDVPCVPVRGVQCSPPICYELFFKNAWVIKVLINRIVINLGTVIVDRYF